jgi:uncharacterized protein with HEPN domain
LPSERPVQRIRDILGAIARIRSYIADIGGVDALMRNEYLHRDGVERQLLIVSEAAAKLRGQVEALEPGINWGGVRGIGNHIWHNYDGVNDDIIRQVLVTDLDGLAAA